MFFRTRKNRGYPGIIHLRNDDFGFCGQPLLYFDDYCILLKMYILLILV